MKPVLLLVGGVLNDATVWDAVTAALPRDLTVRRMDALQPDSVPGMAAACWARVADLPPQQPLLLVGFSLGGYVVLEMLANPQRPVAGAALVASSARPESAEASDVREKTIATMGRDFNKVVDGILAFGTHEAAPALLERLKAMMLRVGAETAIRQNRATQGRGDHRAALARLDLPVTVLCGAQDRITPPALSQELAALVPGARLQLIEGSGHMLPAEQPAAVAAALQALANRITPKSQETNP